MLAEKEQHSEENIKLKQRVGELKRFEKKVRDEKKAALKAKTLRLSPRARLAAGTERCRSDLAGAVQTGDRGAEDQRVPRCRSH